MEVLDIKDFMEGGIIVESAFFDKIENFDWKSLRNKRVLVKGCGTTIVPPWAFMVVAARLADVARSVRYGNEHSSFLIFRRARKDTADVGK